MYTASWHLTLSALTPLSFLAAFSTGAPLPPLAVLTSNSSFVFPQHDPFYVPPSNFAQDPLGTVYRSRAAMSPGKGRQGTQLLFRTSDASGNPATTVTTIITTAKSNTDFLVAYNMYEDAAALQCAPSYGFNTNPGQYFYPDGETLKDSVIGGTDICLTTIFTCFEHAISSPPLSLSVPDGTFSEFLDHGFTTIVTDFEGMSSGFSVGHQSGYQILDSYRAAINYLKLPKQTPLGGFGYSGGAIGCGWSAALHDTYAPELNIKVLVFGGTPTNVTSTLLKVNGGLYSGFGVSGIAGQGASYPELAAREAEIITPLGQDMINRARSHCGVYAITHFAYKDILTTKVQSLGDKMLYDPIIAKYLKLSVMGYDPKETPTRPSIMMYHSSRDEVIPYDSTVDTVKDWCGRGAKIHFITEVGGGGHLGTQMAHASSAYQWLDDMLRGKSPPLTKCEYVTSKRWGLPMKARRFEGQD